MTAASKKSDTYVALLRAFESELDHVTLGNGVIIRRLQWGIDADDETRFASLFDPDNAFVMEYRIDSDERHNEAFDAFSNTVTAMRLTGPGAVSGGDLLKPTNLMIKAGGLGAPRYRLTKESVEPVSALTATLAQGIGDSIRPAISRFNMAYERLTDLAIGRELQQAGDRLIDYWIALESLFLPDEPAQELSYRISLRVAYFISTSPAERREIFREIRRSYGLRSALVHGRKVSDDVQQVTNYTEDALRRALFRAVQSPEALNIRRLDDAIVMGVRTEGAAT